MNNDSVYDIITVVRKVLGGGRLRSSPPLKTISVLIDVYFKNQGILFVFFNIRHENEENCTILY